LEEKMKIKTILLIFMLLCLFRANLVSLIYSRIEGTVLDSDTGLPIVGAKVALFKYGILVEDLCNQISSNKSNTEGYFKFDNIKVGEYSLLIFKEGYAPTAPIHVLKKYLSAELTPHFKAGELTPFYLKEGEVKHFKIDLKKEAVLNVKIYKKTPTENGILNEDATIIILDKENNSEIFDIFTGTYRSQYLKEGFYKVSIYISGFPEKIYDNIELKREASTDIDYVFDFSIGQVVHGFVSDKETKIRLPYTDVLVEKVDENFGVRGRTNEFGEFRIGGLKPGAYFLKIELTIFKIVDYKTYFKINENEIKELKVEINGGY
jgi:5-hydroxyisourate hydrolase-like protein (transthyretin family)